MPRLNRPRYLSKRMSGGDEIRLHRMLQDWNTSDTWNSLASGIQADDVEAAEEAESTSGPGKIEIGQVSFDVTESARFFQEHPDEDFGWVLLPTGTDGNNLLASETHVIPDGVVAFVNTFVGPLRQIDPLEQIAPVLSFVLGSGHDCSGDGVLDAADLACVSSIAGRDAVLAALNTLPGDLDGNGDVAFADFLVLSSHFGEDLLAYNLGNIDLADGIGFADFLVLSANFGKTPTAAAASVPEPNAGLLFVLGLTAMLSRRHLRKP